MTSSGYAFFFCDPDHITRAGGDVVALVWLPINSIVDRWIKVFTVFVPLPS